MPGTAAERPSGNITQLGFDPLAELAARESNTVTPGKLAGLATFGNGEVYRSAPQSRRKTKKRPAVPSVYQQATFDDLFAILSASAEIPRTITTGETRREKKQHGELMHIDLWSLAEISTDDVRAVPERRQTGRGAEQNGAADGRSDVPIGDRAEDGLFSSLG